VTYRFIVLLTTLVRTNTFLYIVLFYTSSPVSTSYLTMLTPCIQNKLL